MAHFTIVQKTRSESNLDKTGNGYRILNVNSDDLYEDIVGDILNISSKHNAKNINYTVFFLSGKNKEIPKLFTLDPDGQFFSDLDSISGDSFNLIYADFIRTGEEKIIQKNSYEGLTYLKEEGRESVLLEEIQSILSNDGVVEDSKEVDFPFALLVKHKEGKILEMTNDIGMLEFNPPFGWNGNPITITRYLMAFMIEIRNTIDADRKESALDYSPLSTVHNEKYHEELSKINVKKIVFIALIKEWIDRFIDLF